MSDSNKRPKDRSSNKPEASKTNNVSRIRREDNNTSNNASSNKPGASKTSNVSRIRREDNNTSNNASSNKPGASKISNASNSRPEDNNSSNSASSHKPGASKTSNNRPEGNSNNSSASNRSTDPHNDGALPKCEYSSPLGGGIVHITGSPSIATGSNAAAITATAFRMTVSAATTARVMGSASIACQ